jgi:hypothetical protein
MKPTVTSREDYLAFVAEWKALYKTLSQAIHQHRASVRRIAGIYASNQRRHGGATRFSKDGEEWVKKLADRRDIAQAAISNVRLMLIETKRYITDTILPDPLCLADNAVTPNVEAFTLMCANVKYMANWMLALRKYWKTQAGIAYLASAPAREKARAEEAADIKAAGFRVGIQSSPLNVV